MRDEHLLVAVCVLLVFDVALLLPWTLVDEITCHQVVSYQHLNVSLLKGESYLINYTPVHKGHNLKGEISG